MATPQIPLLFLSHSGTQKDFTRRLYRELLHVNHNPFFDQDARASLPKGEPFPSRIVEACRVCKLGIVVVSHEYIESLWPMLELQQLLFHNPSSPNNVYPVFYTLKPADLSKTENLTRWQSAWDREAPSWHAKVQDLHMAASGSSTSDVQPTLDISSWPKALDMLRYQSGEILPDNKDEHAFIQTIVRNICHRLPPPDSFLMGDHFKGAEHIQQEIHELFQQQERIDDSRGMPIAVGLYGVGGSGKTTACKYMLSFYNKEYPGSCCFLQFPSREEDESHVLVKSLKEVLAERGNWAKESLDKINSVEQAMPHLQELLKMYKVFFVLDNVWDWALQRAKQIVTMHYMSGSRLLVTARSERLLQTLSSSRRTHINEAVGRSPGMQLVHVPSISEEEAVEALMAYSLTSWQYATNAEDLRGLARSCFFHKQCHPLLLKAVGVKLRHLGGHTYNPQYWTKLISRLQAPRIHVDEEIEDTVLNVLKSSFDALHSKLKNTFLTLGTCVPKLAITRYGSQKYASLQGSSEWLSMLSHNGSYTIKDIRDQLVELEYHGLIQIYKVNDYLGSRENVAIHDLQMMLIKNIVREKNGAPRCFFFEGDVATLSASDWTRLKYISGFLEEGTDLTALSPQRRQPFDLRDTSPNQPNIVVLHLQARPWRRWRDLRDPRQVLGDVGDVGQRLSLKYMQSLRYLELTEVKILKELGGWHGAPNLVSVKLYKCSKLQKIESMACLCKLEILVIKRCMSSGQYVTNFSSCENLKELVIEGNYHVKHLAILGHLPQLQKLSLSGCGNLVDVGTLVSAFPSLQSCNLGGTGILKFPEFSSISLRKLDLSKCERLESMEGSVCGLTALEELNLKGCSNLESIPDLKQLVKLSWCNLQGTGILKCPDFRSISLRELDLSKCKRLQSMEGSVCGLTALEQLDFGGCSNLESIPDLKQLVNLRRLKFGECHALKEVKLGDAAALTSLVSLSLQYSCRLISSMSCSPLPITAFTNLRHHWAYGDKWGSRKISIDVGSSTLPVSLEHLSLENFETAEEITGLSALVNLKGLFVKSCPSLTKITGVGTLTKLRYMSIENCASLREVGDWETGHLTSLKICQISGCPKVQMETLPQGVDFC